MVQTIWQIYKVTHFVIFSFIGAIVWSFYSNVTKRISGGHNGMVLFFIMTSIVMDFIFSTPTAFIINSESLLLLLLPLLRLVGRMHYGHLRLSRAMWLF